MKCTILFISFCLLSFFTMAQTAKLSIHTTPPKELKVGASHTLKVSVSHTFKTEQTGNLILSLLNNKTQQSVDGWFLNVFPFQYFTTISGTPFDAEFPFTVPDAYEGKFDILLVAEVDKIKDSIRFTVPTRKK